MSEGEAPIFVKEGGGVESSDRSQPPFPMLGTATCFHADQARLAIGEMLEEHGALQLLVYNLTRLVAQ